MNWEAIGAVGEVVGALAVFLTLLYLARQVRDGSKQTRLNTTSNLASLSQESFAPIFNSEQNQRIWHQGLDAPSELSEEELRIYFTYMDRVFYSYQLLVTYYSSGVVEDDLFATQSAYFKYLFHTTGGQEWHRITALQLTEQAIKYLRDGA